MAQLTFTCTKSIVETLEKGSNLTIKATMSRNKKSNEKFHSVFIVDLEQIYVSWNVNWQKMG